jgi:hypothetical protein
MVGRTVFGMTALAVGCGGKDGMIHLFQWFPGLGIMTDRAQTRANVDVLPGPITTVTGQAVGSGPQGGMIHPFERLPGRCIMTGRTLTDDSDVVLRFLLFVARFTVGCL